MSYDSQEISAASGRPIEIFDFTRGTQEWLFTSSNGDKTVSSKVYASAAIIRPEISHGAELNRAGLKLTVPRDFPIAVLFRAGIPAETINLRIRQYHEGDGALAVIWTGRVMNVARVGEIAEIVCEPLFTSVRATGLRRRYQKNCPHVLYGNKCGVNKNTFKLTTAVTSVSGLTVSASGLSAQPDGWWEGGYIEWSPSAGVFERQFIMGHTGGSITLMTQPIGLAASAALTVYPGCDRTMGAGGCGKYSNEPNFGGCPDMTSKNPFGSDPVY